MSTPKVSVIIPYYNSKNTIIETVQSVLNQTYTCLEIIIVNDGSTESLSKDIFNDKRIQIIHQDNQGQTAARINGANVAQGEYFCFLDADDIIAPKYIESCVAILDKDSSIKLAYSKARYFGYANKKWRLPKFNIHSFLFENCIFVTAVHRKKDYLSVGGFDRNLTYFEDWELWINILSKGGKVHRINKELFFYRRDNNNTSVLDKGNKNTNIKDQSIEYIYKKHQLFYEQTGYTFYDIFRNNRFKYKYQNQWFKKIF